MTERERLKRELNRLEEFTDIASHDLRNPLNVTEGRLELARMECDSDHLEAIERGHERMQTLIENLLALARSGERVDATESVDLSAAVERAWANVETASATPDIETDRTVAADPSGLGQLLENLFRNAVEHGTTNPGSQAPPRGIRGGSPDSQREANDADTVDLRQESDRDCPSR